jgi:hypothetical protein
MIPEPMRGRSILMIDGAVLGDDATAEAILAPLRALRPEMDTFGRMPAAALSRLHMDPEGPTPGVSATSILGELPSAAIDAFIAAAGPGSGSVLLAAELRQLGGALSRPAEGAGALPSFDGQFLMFGVAIAPEPELGRLGKQHADRLVAALSPRANGRKYLNFVEEPSDAAAGYRPAEWARLRTIRDAVDPAGVFHANHPVPRTS